MPKVLIKFRLPKEQREYDITNQAPQMMEFLWHFSQQLRSWFKYHHDFKDADDAVIKIRDEFYRLLNEHDVNINL